MIRIASNIFNNIERIDFHEFEKDFLFIVNGEIYQTNWVYSVFRPGEVFKKFHCYQKVNLKSAWAHVNALFR